MKSFSPASLQRNSNEAVRRARIKAADDFPESELHDGMTVRQPGSAGKHADEDGFHQVTAPVVTVFAFAGSRSLRVKTAITLAMTLAVPVSSSSTRR